MRLIALDYQHSRLQVRYARAVQRQKALRVELATLRQLSRIEAIATQYLGLRYPAVSQVIYVRSSAAPSHAEGTP